MHIYEVLTRCLVLNGHEHYCVHTLNIIQNVTMRMDVATARIVLSGRMNEKNVTSMLRP